MTNGTAFNSSAAGNSQHHRLLRLRGVLAIGLAGGVHWALVFALLGIIIGIVDPASIDEGEDPLSIGLIGAGIGLVSGIVFALLMALGERGKAISGISLGRVALWGILGSAAFPLLTGRADQVFIMCPIGAVFSVVLMLIARGAEPRKSNSSARLRDIFFAAILRSVEDAVNPAKASVR